MFPMRSFPSACLLFLPLALACSDGGSAGADAAPPPPPNTSWSWIDVGEGAKPVLALDSGGTAHIAYMFESQPGWVRYASVSPDATSASAPSEIATGYFYGPIGIALKDDATPQVVYHDHDLEDQVLAEARSGGNWSLSTMINDGHDGWYNSIVTDDAGNAHTASFYPSGFNGLGVFYGVFDGTSWTTELAAPGSFDYAGGVSIALGDNDTVYIAYFDDGAGVAKLARRKGVDDWEEIIVQPKGTLIESGRFPKLAMVGDTVHMVFLARDTESSGTIRYASGTFDNLSVRDVAPIDNIEIGFSGARDIATLAVADDGRVAVAYQSKRSTFLALIDDAGIDTEEVSTDVGNGLGQQTSIAIGADKVHLVIWQSGGTPGTVRYGVRSIADGL